MNSRLTDAVWKILGFNVQANQELQQISQTKLHIVSDLVLHELGVAAVDLHLLHLLLTLLAAQKSIGFQH